ncbi:hypothetical protein B0T10DRAFT_489885 [Thelonectria olida]|uniref:Uncharacterized protein n=1 Tax=Thelonectria olida TaxID=1576542 RepID=A0A9P9AKL2_9HYPO|nr:hypothetical protein B0T10DRAFT_489885 [Thelonectria olida]
MSSSTTPCCHENPRPIWLSLPVTALILTAPEQALALWLNSKLCIWHLPSPASFFRVTLPTLLNSHAAQRFCPILSDSQCDMSET